MNPLTFEMAWGCTSKEVKKFGLTAAPSPPAPLLILTIYVSTTNYQSAFSMAGEGKSNHGQRGRALAPRLSDSRAPLIRQHYFATYSGFQMDVQVSIKTEANRPRMTRMVRMDADQSALIRRIRVIRGLFLFPS